MYEILDKINSPEDIKTLSAEEINLLCEEIREFLIDTVLFFMDDENEPIVAYSLNDDSYCIENVSTNEDSYLVNLTKQKVLGENNEGVSATLAVNITP